MPHVTTTHNKSSCPTLLCCCWTPLLLVFVAGYATQHHFAHLHTKHNTATKLDCNWSTKLDRRYCAACRPLLHASVAPVLVATVEYHKICHGWGQVVPREQLCAELHTTWWRNLSARGGTLHRGIWGVGLNYWRLWISLVEIYMFGIMCGKYVKLLY